VGPSIIPFCTQHIYLGSPVRVLPTTPARQRVYPIVQELLTRSYRRLEPLRWLTNNAAGVSIPVARNIYTAFIRSVVDYLSPALSQLSRTVLDPLENFQNKIMRCILGCPMSTRIVNMQQELHLPPLVERIYANVTCFTVKCLRSPNLAPHYAGINRMSLGPNFRRPQLRPGGCALIRNVLPKP